EAVGAHAVAAGPLRETGQTCPCGPEDVTGNARGDGRHNTLAREFLSEQVQETRLHRIRRRAAAESEPLVAQRRAPRLRTAMRPLALVGVLLIATGLLALVYQGI